MCGKFTQMASWQRVHDYSNFLALAAAAANGAAKTEDNFVTPMRFADILHLGDDGKRAMTQMRWGFADRRSKTPQDRPKHMHARAETIDTLPTFAQHFARNRGLAIVNTFNIGEEVTSTKTIQHTITPRDGKPLALAVLYERWLHRDEGELMTFVMVTVPANRLIATKTDRMPAVIPPEDWAKWLGEEPAGPDELKALLKTVEGDWEMREQRRTPPPRRPENPQTKLF